MPPVLEPGTALWHKTFARAMVLVMTTSVHVWFADILLNGMAGLAFSLIVYLFRLEFRQRREQRKFREQRLRQRRGHWGYE